MNVPMYPAVAERCGAEPDCVERATRHAIGVAWKHVAPEQRLHYFGRIGGSRKGRPTNGGGYCGGRRTDSDGQGESGMTAVPWRRLPERAVMPVVSSAKGRG